ncbi:DNA cytosine methyltransferase [Rhodococcoides navarretei]|uniref:DNA (cytosine-5-)-methyltransferase n=1 Tax=Rhodococcus navarretei TaxID=3128981 RepID=A0ABU9CTI4_9NOCA
MAESLDAHLDVVDLFAGPGGLDVGASWLGLSVCGIELDPRACETRMAAGLRTVQGDVRIFGPDDFPGAKVLAGGPPCQTFTIAGSGTGRKAIDTVLGLVDELASGKDIATRLRTLHDERTGLVVEPLRWAMQALRQGTPYESIVLEQVPAVLPVWKAIGRVLAANGYDVCHDVLRTEQFGVPQTRRRAVLIARRNGKAALPPETHQAYHKGTLPPGESHLLGWVSMADALNRNDEFTVISNYGSGGDPKNRGRRSADQPAATVTGKITRNRLQFPDGRQSRLSLPEAGILQTFPSDFPWRGGDIGQQVGNAVPPRFAAHVLATATGRLIDSARLDEAVRLPWSESSSGVSGIIRETALREPLLTG